MGLCWANVLQRAYSKAQGLLGVESSTRLILVDSNQFLSCPTAMSFFQNDIWLCHSAPSLLFQWQLFRGEMGVAWMQQRAVATAETEEGQPTGFAGRLLLGVRRGNAGRLLLGVRRGNAGRLLLGVRRGNAGRLRLGVRRGKKHWQQSGAWEKGGGASLGEGQRVQLGQCWVHGTCRTFMGRCWVDIDSSNHLIRKCWLGIAYRVIKSSDQTLWLQPLALPTF